jgi:hypothetical protein
VQRDAAIIKELRIMEKRQPRWKKGRTGEKESPRRGREGRGSERERELLANFLERDAMQLAYRKWEKEGERHRR